MFRRRLFRRRGAFRRKRRTFRKRRVFRRNTGAYTKRFFKLRRLVATTQQPNQPNWLQFNDNPSLSQDWTSVSALFQMYRVNGIKLTWIPAFNTNEMTQASDPNVLVPIYYVHDTNMSITSIPTENEVLQYENMKIRSVTRMHSIYYKMSRRINATAPGTLSTDGYSSVQFPQITQQICALIPNASTQTIALGRHVVTAYLSAKVRR